MKSCRQAKTCELGHIAGTDSKPLPDPGCHNRDRACLMNGNIDPGACTLQLLKSAAPIEDFLYHYTTTQIAIESILYSRKLKYSSLKRSNDPLEALNVLHVTNYTGSDGPGTDVGYRFGQNLNRILKSGYKVCSFCIDSPFDDDYPFNKGYTKSRMWNQYGADHEGVCLVFSKSKLIYAIQREMGRNYGEGKYELSHNAITYIKNPRQFDQMTFVNINDPAFNNEASCKQKLDKYIETYLFTKLKDYEGEKEYRIALYHPSFEDKKEVFLDVDNALRAVILGYRCRSAYQTNFREYQKEMNFGLFSTCWFNGNVDISFVR